MTALTEANKPGSLGAWLQYLSELNPEHMELGLDRVRTVATRLNLLSWPNTLIIEVAGTNGKGSTAALTAGMLERAGVSCGLYTSPHLHHFNERAVCLGKEISDHELCEAMSKVWDAAHTSPKVPLTYFEYTTLASLWWFKQCNVAALVLEIGLGGRLDAVNILDAQIAVITSIGFDHTKILGNTLSKIACEKAGIIKEKSSVVIGTLPQEALTEVRRIAELQHAVLYEWGKAFDAMPLEDESAMIFSLGKVRTHVPYPRVPWECAALALEIAKILKDHGISISEDAQNAALREVALPGRLQLVHKDPAVYLDVAHNPPAAEHLKKALSRHKLKGVRRYVIGMLKDKDIESVLKILSGSAKFFYVSSLHTGRGESAMRLKSALLSCGVAPTCVSEFDEVAEALEHSLLDAGRDDEIVICGSFVTVSLALDHIHEFLQRGDHSWL